MSLFTDLNNMAANKCPVQKSKELNLPISRIRTIMKSSPDVENISQDSVYLVAKATELFIQYIASNSFKYAGSTNNLEYKQVAELVEKSDNLMFLKEIVPKKITYKQYKELMKKKQQNIPVEIEEVTIDDS